MFWCELDLTFCVSCLGQAGWGIAWYINGVLIPELIVERGIKYTFIINGGNDPQDLANYHPFYITSSNQGGRSRNSATEKAVSCCYYYFMVLK